MDSSSVLFHPIRMKALLLCQLGTLRQILSTLTTACHSRVSTSKAETEKLATVERTAVARKECRVMYGVTSNVK